MHAASPRSLEAAKERALRRLSIGVAWLQAKSTELSYHIRYHIATRSHGSPGMVLGETPVDLLGTRYEVDAGGGRAAIDSRNNRIVDDLRSRLHFTYRNAFEAHIDGTTLTSDVGWGCMLRCGQMILAQALIMLLAGREWRSRNIQRWYTPPPATASGSGSGGGSSGRDEASVAATASPRDAASRLEEYLMRSLYSPAAPEPAVADLAEEKAAAKAKAAADGAAADDDEAASGASPPPTRASPTDVSEKLPQGAADGEGGPTLEGVPALPKVPPSPSSGFLKVNDMGDVLGDGELFSLDKSALAR